MSSPRSLYSRILIFGDSTVEKKLPSIQELWRLSNSCPVLKRFLHQAFAVIHKESQSLGTTEASLFQYCIDVVELAESVEESGEPDEIVATVLVCIERLGELILDAERNGSLWPNQAKARVIGFCTGLLSGAVATLARDAAQVAEIGCEILAIAFRLAVAFTRRSQLIEAKAGRWATSIIGPSTVELQVLLDHFNMIENLPKTMQAYIGVTSRSWNTVFGPPSTIEKLSSTEIPTLDKLSKLKIAAAAAVHAAHLSNTDLDWVVGNSVALETPIPEDAILISTSTGQPYEASNLRNLMELIISDITTNVLDMDLTIQGAAKLAEKSVPIELLGLGPSYGILATKRLFELAGFKVNVKAVIATDGLGRLARRGGTKSTGITITRRLSKEMINED